MCVPCACMNRIRNRNARSLQLSRLFTLTDKNISFTHKKQHSPSVIGIDPFANQADLLDQDQEEAEKKQKKEKIEKVNADSVQDKYIHIRTQQRNGRKSLTTLQGINPKINKKIILKECKKKFNCNGTIVEDSELGDIIQLQGDQRKNVAQFLIDEKISKKEFIKVHGS